MIANRTFCFFRLPYSPKRVVVVHMNKDFHEIHDDTIFNRILDSKFLKETYVNLVISIYLLQREHIWYYN